MSHGPLTTYIPDINHCWFQLLASGFGGFEWCIYAYIVFLFEELSYYYVFPKLLMIHVFFLNFTPFLYSMNFYLAFQASKAS